MSEQTNQTASDQAKDPMITFKSVMQSVNETGKKRITLSLTQEGTLTLIEALTSVVNNERGSKLDIHVKRKATNDGTREFDSAFAFVKAIQEFGAQRPGGGVSNGAPKKSFPSTPTKGYVDSDRLAAAKAKLNKTIA